MYQYARGIASFRPAVATRPNHMDAPAPPKESVDNRHAKFRELAECRTNAALEAIRRIGNLSNRQLYHFEETEVRKILKVLRDAVADIETRFASPKGRTGGKFKL
jgi:hypothetical protein